MARYVEYTPDVFSQTDRGVNVWWFPTTFSQSQLGDRVIGSNACTLIAVLLGGRVTEFNIVIWGYQDQPLSRMLVTSLAEAIIEGNEIHESLMAEGTVNSMDLTVPEALRAVQFKYSNLVEWGDRTAFVNEPLAETLIENLLPVIIDFEHAPPERKRPNTDLFAILVCDGRSVLFVYQPSTAKVTVIDSHAHSSCMSGAVIAQARFGDLEQLCNWFFAMLTQSFERGARVQPYELAFLYIRDDAINPSPS
ncbi:hypothetical protein Ocin01_03719 [Orchesella cincta]|uniref:Uncharacterized protein n=1 Tax=Orchesella cincta TaxID=48709 RepID=A0A1D2NCH8_ORCCI|nr:hypothetical protein Ocin01_03719 [Orchesella cincta]